VQSKTAIIIVSYKTPWYLDMCLDSVFKHTQDFHIYLVHNSQDTASYGVGDKYLTRYPKHLTVVKNSENLGLVEGIAAVYDHAIQHDRICLLNSDTVVNPDWLNTMNGEMDTNFNISMIVPDSNCYYPDSLVWKVIKALPFGMSRIQKLQLINPKKNLQMRGFEADNFFMAFGGGFCSLFKSEHIKKRGYILDPNIAHGYWDDLELTLFLRTFGDIGSTNKAYVFHFTGASFKILGKKRHDARKQALSDWNGFYVFKKWRSWLEEKLGKMSPTELQSVSNNSYVKDFLRYLALTNVSSEFDTYVDTLPAKAIWDELRSK